MATRTIKTATAKPAKGGAKPATAKPAKGATAAAPATPPAGGYLLLNTANTFGGSRGKRWPLICECSGKPNGVELLAKGLKDGGYKQSASGTLKGWLAPVGLVWLHGQPKPAEAK
jgi:hypothetical protein